MPKTQYKHKTYKRHKKRDISERFWEKVNIKNENDCWEWRASTRHGFGYGQFSFNGYPEFAHRVSWIIKYGDIPNNTVICHACDNPLCVNPLHLFLGNQLTNIKDMMSKSRDAFVGERNPNAKLNEKMVREAIRLRDNGNSFTSISRVFNVSRQTITDAIKRKTWKHIK